jgi:hypothetical protein
LKVDRVACPWLINRFVDKEAGFHFVPADRVAAEAERLGAVPFDVPGAELGHHGKEGFRHLGLKDDHAINAAEWIVYDALYAYCRVSIQR